MFFADFPISIDNIWSDSASPLADALDEAVAVAERWDVLRRLHSALMDMDQVAHAARELVTAKERGWPNVEDETKEIRKLNVLGEVLETGMVTMYARHFTGDRRLPGRWWPRGKRKLVHDRLIERRNTVVAHADETTERKLITLPTEGDGPPVTVIAEARQPMTEDDLREVVHHCKAMYARYSDAVLQLKSDLGIAASGEILGASAYDE